MPAWSVPLTVGILWIIGGAFALAASVLTSIVSVLFLGSLLMVVGVLELRRLPHPLAPGRSSSTCSPVCSTIVVGAMFLWRPLSGLRVADARDRRVHVRERPVPRRQRGARALPALGLGCLLRLRRGRRSVRTSPRRGRSPPCGCCGDDRLRSRLSCAASRWSRAGSAIRRSRSGEIATTGSWGSSTRATPPL